MDFTDMCRLCLCVETTSLLKYLSNDSENLIDKIHTISKIKVHADDGLPAQVCQDCINLVNICYNFKLQVEKSDMILKHHVSILKESGKVNERENEDEKNYVDWELPCNSTELKIDDVNIEASENLSSQKVEELTIKEESVCIESTNALSTNDQQDVTVMAEQSKEKTSHKRVEQRIQWTDPSGENTNSFKTLNNCGAEMGCEPRSQTMRENLIVASRSSNINIQQPILFKNSSTLKTFSEVNTEIRHRKYRECDVCGKSVQNLTTHMKVHTGEKPHQCTLCGQRFIQKGNLQKHLLVHTGERPYNCPECGKTYVCISDLNQHRKLHTGTAFVCSVCEKGFTSRQNLESHERVHTGEKPYLCQICGISFALKGALTKHSRRIHANDLTHLCSVCNKRFISQSSLNNHSRTHTGEKPYTCDICHNSFADRGYFMRHLRVHSGEKSFCCFVCSKRFTQQISLKRHIRLHTGEKPFHCAICDDSFVLKRDLKKHTERLHNADIQLMK